MNGEVKLVLNEKFYYTTQDMPAEKISKSRKRFLALFGKKAKRVDQYIKKNKLSIKQKEDLIEIFTYYNQLSQ